MRNRRFIPSRRPGDTNNPATSVARSTRVVLKRQAERAETYEPGEHPVHVAKAELLTSARTGSVSVKLTASHLEDGKPVALTPLLVEGRAENLHRLSELARLNGHELDAEPDEKRPAEPGRGARAAAPGDAGDRRARAGGRDGGRLR